MEESKIDKTMTPSLPSEKQKTPTPPPIKEATPPLLKEPQKIEKPISDNWDSYGDESKSKISS